MPEQIPDPEQIGGASRLEWIGLIFVFAVAFVVQFFKNYSQELRIRIVILIARAIVTGLLITAIGALVIAFTNIPLIAIIGGAGILAWLGERAIYTVGAQQLEKRIGVKLPSLDPEITAQPPQAPGGET